MIALIAGNRPQYIKAEIILKKLKCTYIDTGQHYGNMASPFIKTKPNYSLKVDNSRLISLMSPLYDLLSELRPQLVVVIGDTNTTLAGALVANELHIPIAHIESGLRSYEDMPEESNRVMVDHISKYHFCPTKSAIENLAKEGIYSEVYASGDVMAEVISGTWEPEDYILATIHRQANVDKKDKLENVLNTIKTLYPGEHIVWPMHPRTAKMIKEFGLDTGEIDVIEPVNFEEMIELERHAKSIVTDSGGVMREAYLLGVPFIVLRNNTEWEELKSGERGLLGSDASDRIKNILEDYE
jgi:UDP-N-acetylglucosamine 2-epimerase